MCAYKCVCGGGIVVYYCVWTYEWCLVYVCMKIHTQRDKLEVIFRIDERCYVEGFATRRPRKKICICFFIYLFAEYTDCFSAEG